MAHQAPLSSIPGKNTAVGCHFLLQGIFLTLRSNPRLLHWQADSLPSEPPGKPPARCSVGLKQQRFILSQFWSPKSISLCWNWSVYSGGSRGKSVSCLFLLPVVFWLVTPSSPSQDEHCSIFQPYFYFTSSFPLYHSPSAFLLLGYLWLHLWTHLDNPESSSHLKIFNLITPTEAPLP